MRQTRLAVAALEAACPGLQFEITPISTAGDRDKSSPLAAVGVSVFVKELEEALADGRVDMAVHSLKDMPSRLPDGYVLAGLLPRGDPRDVLVSRFRAPLEDIPAGARIGTGSPRRAALLRALRPDIETAPIRGNVDTRLRKALEGEGRYDGAILAASGLQRLDRMEDHFVYLDPESFTPASGQGTLVIETSEDNQEASDIAAAIDDPPTRLASTAERAFLARLGAGCNAPASAYATLAGGEITVRGFVAATAGERNLFVRRTGPQEQAQEIATALAEEMLEQGAGEMING